MDSAKRAALEAAGWRLADAADFLEMSYEERQLLDARIETALAVRRQRQALHLSQKELAMRINTSQPRIAKIERAAPDVSLDQMLRAFAAAGGQIAIRQVRGTAGSASSNRAPRSARKRQGKTKKGRSSGVQIDLIAQSS